jgi:hypothetical protein
VFYIRVQVWTLRSSRIEERLNTNRSGGKGNRGRRRSFLKRNRAYAKAVRTKSNNMVEGIVEIDGLQKAWGCKYYDMN